MVEVLIGDWFGRTGIGHTWAGGAVRCRSPAASGRTCKLTGGEIVMTMKKNRSSAGRNVERRTGAGYAAGRALRG
jgi:hypothetical protein